MNQGEYLKFVEKYTVDTNLNIESNIFKHLAKWINYRTISENSSFGKHIQIKTFNRRK